MFPSLNRASCCLLLSTLCATGGSLPAVGSDALIITLPDPARLQPWVTPSGHGRAAQAGRGPDMLSWVNGIGRTEAHMRAGADARRAAEAELQAGHRAVVVEIWRKDSHHGLDTTSEFEARVAGRGATPHEAMYEAVGPSVRPDDGKQLAHRFLYTASGNESEVDGSTSGAGLSNPAVPVPLNMTRDQIAESEATTAWYHMRAVGAEEAAAAWRERSADDVKKAEDAQKAAELRAARAAEQERIAREEAEASKLKADQERLLAAEQEAHREQKAAEEAAQATAEQKRSAERAEAVAAVFDCIRNCATEAERAAAERKANEMMEENDRVQGSVALCGNPDYSMDSNGGGGCGGVRPDHEKLAHGARAALWGSPDELKRINDRLSRNFLDRGQLGLIQRDGSILIRRQTSSDLRSGTKE